MKIELNGATMELQEGTRVADVVEERTGRREPQGVAVAVNGEVVRRGAWADTALKDGDQVEILAATAGG